MIHEYLSLIVCIVGGFLYIALAHPEQHWAFVALRELCKWAFIIGLAAFLWGK